MSAATDTFDDAQARRTLATLSSIVREMTPIGAKSIPVKSEAFNFLARPHQNGCRVCGLPGHQSVGMNADTTACSAAIRSLLSFWKGVAEQVNALYCASKRFEAAIAANKPTYAMRLDNGPQVCGDLETVIVDRLTRNWLKFSAWLGRVRAKLCAGLVDMEGRDGEKLEVVSQVLNDFLLGGKTLTDLFEQATQDKEIVILE